MPPAVQFYYAPCTCTMDKIKYNSHARAYPMASAICIYDICYMANRKPQIAFAIRNHNQNHNREPL